MLAVFVHFCREIIVEAWCIETCPVTVNCSPGGGQLLPLLWEFLVFGRFSLKLLSPAWPGSFVAFFGVHTSYCGVIIQEGKSIPSWALYGSFELAWGRALCFSDSGVVFGTLRTGVSGLCKVLGWVMLKVGFLGGSGSKESACQCRTPRFDPWVRKIPWRREWPLQYSCLENSVAREAWRATVHGVTLSPSPSLG